MRTDGPNSVVKPARTASSGSPLFNSPRILRDQAWDTLHCIWVWHRWRSSRHPRLHRTAFSRRRCASALGPSWIWCHSVSGESLDDSLLRGSWAPDPDIGVREDTRTDAIRNTCFMILPSGGGYKPACQVLGGLLDRVLPLKLEVQW